MDGTKDARKTQLGPEIKNAGAPGTAVLATWLWRGNMIGSDDSERSYPDEGLGRFMGTTRNIKPSIKGSLKQGPDPLDFEQLPYILNGSVRCLKAGVKDGAGSGYIRDYVYPLEDKDIEKTGITIGFTSATKTIADSGSGLAFVKTGDLIQISGSASNNGYFTVATGGVAGSIVVNEVLVTEAAGASVTIEVMTQVSTIEDGNNKRVNRSAFCFPYDWEISGNGGSDLDFYKMSSSWYAQQWAKYVAGFTALNPVPVSTAYFGNSRLYLDAIGGTMGTTELTKSLTSFSVKSSTGLGRKFSGDGNLFFGKQGRKMPTLSCSMGLWNNDLSLIEWDYAQAGTPRLLRVAIEGPTLTTAGTLYSKKMIIFNFPGTWEPMKNLEDIDGYDIIPLTFRPAWDETTNLGPSIRVVNEIATMA